MDVNNFDALEIRLASPRQIRDWSYGEVKKPETINYRTLKPERDGLFCERIFGPIKDWECHCGKYKRIRFKGVICDKCGVEVTRSKVRRERMGHIELASPVTHIWYFKGVPSRLGLLLDMSPRTLEKVIYFASYVVIDPGDSPLNKRQLLTELEYRENREKYGNSFRAGMGAEAVKEMLSEIEVNTLHEQLKEDLKTFQGQKRTKAIKRLEVVEAFRKSKNSPEWMILDVIPVIPPELRPMVQLDGGRFATSDLNDLYRRVINRNNRLKRLLDLGAPEIIVKNEKRMLQEAVDALIDNGRRGRPVTGPNNRPLKSLSDMLKGKQGRFRQNLLGKRVDYSGRSVIVVGPNLKLHQCGLPKEMALELFKPFVMKKLVDRGLVHNIKSAKRMVERALPDVWDVLEEVIEDHPVLLNRAPTLHRLGIQAFEPVLVDGKAIQLHPLVCTPYNADFDGDQMAVHLPLSAGAQAEARVLMLSSNNLLLPAYGTPATIPNQDTVLGMYYLTIEKHHSKGEGKYFSSPEEAILAWTEGVVELQAPVKIRLGGELVGTTVGRALFWRTLPPDVKQPEGQELGSDDADFPGKAVYRLRFEDVNKTFGKKDLVKLIKRVHDNHGNNRTARMLDSIKDLGFEFATKSATTIGVVDIRIPPEKPEILERSDKRVQAADQWMEVGFITEDERYRQLKTIWSEATSEVEQAMMRHLDRLNPVFMMATSGARGNPAQVKQLGGMRGLMADPTGRIIPLPVRSNLREGLTVLEYFISTHGARKGLADTALRTADSGYLTRRLIDVSQDIIVRQDDCGTMLYAEVGPCAQNRDVKVPLWERIAGRYPAEDIHYVDDKGNEQVAKRNVMLDDAEAQLIDRFINKDIDVSTRGKKIAWPRVKVRSVLSCEAPQGVCAMCYGRNLATGQLVEIGETVGIIAAQSIGEPGTQLTLRTFHTGGVAQEDIIQGLPRVEELFEARKPKGHAQMAELEGIVTLGEDKGMRQITITSPNGETVTTEVPYSSRILVRDGETVSVGTQIVGGFMNPHDILRLLGVSDTQRYIVDEVQNVYRDQGVDINDRHVEVIVRQMMRKVKLESSGDTTMLPGVLVELQSFQQQNRAAIEAGKEPADAKRALLGVTKASLATESFLSAASFQETTRVLTDAAIKGKIDSLRGLKENVIIGKLIPAGTGMHQYRGIEPELPKSATATVEAEPTAEDLLAAELSAGLSER
ncbi:MAG: DNA-directed RNA polymerase subunit beta' [Candidatus Eremiobacteraeota bacterium]|nr:DNA-directed RNA polymerase subunit beta' [Candidatus Eremiobacteraeota bacterium]MCW5871925.1 DNA-directed RNA polymerase subunit beta' [Candidatus Eremiobacteraeota bacterium]